MNRRKMMWLLLFATLLLSSCASIKRGVLSSIGRMFTAEGENGNSFTRDDDPILVEESLPTMLKLIELMRDAAPKSPDLNFGAGQIAVMYAGGFLQPKLEQVASFTEKKRQQERTKAMYLRGRESILEGLRQRYKNKGFDEKFAAENLDPLLAMMRQKDVPFLYWGSLAWFGAFALDPFDFDLLTSISTPILLLWRAMQLQPEDGDLHTSLISIMGSLPLSQIFEALNHSPEIIEPFFTEYYRDIDWKKDRRSLVGYHFAESLRLSEGKDPSPYVAMANWIKGHQSDSTVDKKQFKEYLEKALEIKPEENISNRLLILIYQQQARQQLALIDEYFL